jgi:hypothetical protein
MEGGSDGKACAASENHAKQRQATVRIRVIVIVLREYSNPEEPAVDSTDRARLDEFTGSYELPRGNLAL